MKHINRVAAAVLAASLLGGCASTGGGSIAGLYSTSHNSGVPGAKIAGNGYIDIDPTGAITVYTQQPGAGCYRLASGNDTNARLQGLKLTPGSSPKGEPDYQVMVEDDVFGILTEPSPNGTFRWFFHGGAKNNTVTVVGMGNLVNARTGSYSISGPPVAASTLAQVLAMRCAG